MSSSTRFGKYDLLALLATGGMAEIWLARVSGMAGFEKLVVIKRLLDKLAIDPEYVEMFLDEARRGGDQLQKVADRFIGLVDQMAARKEAEIMEV